METTWFLTGIFLLVLVAAYGVYRLNVPNGHRPPDTQNDQRTRSPDRHTLSGRERAYVEWFTRQDA